MTDTVNIGHVFNTCFWGGVIAISIILLILLFLAIYDHHHLHIT